MIRFRLAKSLENVRPEIDYVLRLWAKNQGHIIIIGDDVADGILIADTGDLALCISPDFVTHHSQTSVFRPSKIDVNGPFLIEDAFRLINSLQEFQSSEMDELGRFTFKGSYQCRIGNHKVNLVQQMFNNISIRAGLQPKYQKTKFFLTHDIDLVHGAILEDGFHALKRGRIDQFLKMLFNVAIDKPEWLNMDKIMKLESEYDCHSIFFWIVNQGKINQRERNADYSFSSPKIKKQFNYVRGANFENGIHKSLSNETFASEFTKYGATPFANRYHYLKFRLPEAYHDIEEAALKLDTSLGFAEEIGFRNSYGLPFNPFDFKKRKPFFFVEAPLHVMDRTYFQYKKFSPQDALKDILNFFEMNTSDCVISVLWHNNFFTDYKFKGYLDIYKRILSYIHENKFETLTAPGIVKNYSIES